VSRRSDPARIEITAHRGDPVRAPENTLASLRAGLGEGADALEWDVRICRTGEAVVIHDETVDRTTDGTGRVAELPFQELRALDAGSWFSPDHEGARIPSLAEAVELAAGSGVRVYCEVKAIRDERDAATVVEPFGAADLLDRTAFISLYPDILRAFRAAAPRTWLGWVVAREQEMAPAVEWVRADGRAVLAPAAEILLGRPDRTRALIDDGMIIGTWTVDEVAQAEALVALGVRRFTTNRVRELAAWARGARARG
jgi:glycerophosphoryl diester phosphodiesterase